MSRPPRRRLPTARPLLAALALAVSVMGALAVVGDRAGAQAPEASPTLRLAHQTSWVGPDGVFQVSVVADGLPAGSTAGAVLHQRVRTRAALDAALGGGSPGGNLFTVRARPVSEITGPDGTVTVSLPVSAGAGATIDTVTLGTPGVYPYTVQIFGPDDKVEPIAELRTTMVRLGAPATSSRLSVGVVVPVHTPVSLAFDGTPVLDDEGAADLVATIGAVASRPDVQLTLSPSPESLELLAARDAAGQAAVAELRTRVGRQLLANPYAPIDTGAWVQSGLGAEMSVQWTAGAGAAQAQLGTIPDPTTATLDRTVTPAALARMNELGVRYVTVPSNQLDPLGTTSATTTFAEQFDIETNGSVGTASLRAVVADDTTATRLSTGDDPVLAGHDALAELALLHLLHTSDAQGVAVVVPTDTDPDALSTFLTGLAERDGTASGSVGDAMVSPVTLTELFSTTAVAESTRSTGSQTLVRGYQADAPGELGRYPGQLRSSRSSIAGLQSLVPGSPTLAEPAVAATLSSGDRTLAPEQRTAILGSADRTVSSVAGEIVVAAEQVVTLTSSSGKVPLNLENRLQEEAHVRIVLSSAKLDFPEGAVIEQVLPAQQTTIIELPVETRASGAFTLTVTITSADGTLPVATTKYTVRSTAISGVGLVLSIGAGLFLLVWWARHFRTARRARKLVASNHPALSGSEPGGYAPPDSDPLEGR